MSFNPPCSHWTRFIAEGSLGSQKRFVHGMGLFLEGITIQARSRATGVILDLEDYIILRRDTSGLKPCWALIEYAGGLNLPEEVLEHPIVQSLEEAANDWVAWSNVGTLARLSTSPDAHSPHPLGYLLLQL